MSGGSGHPICAFALSTSRNQSTQMPYEHSQIAAKMCERMPFQECC